MLIEHHKFMKSKSVKVNKLFISKSAQAIIPPVQTLEEAKK